jgi:predicted Rossmann-fold nucleotide-binding protein
MPIDLCGKINSAHLDHCSMHTPDSLTSEPNSPRSASASEYTAQVIQDTVLRLWDVINNLTRIQPPQSDRYRVTIFGSARLQPDSPLYTEVRQLASVLTTMGCDIITGGGPGLMQAANQGSVMADPADQTQSIGIRVDLDLEQATNPFVEKVYTHRTFFSRLHHFVLLSNAYIIVPGGIGTTLEALMIWQLLQVRKLHDTPFIMVGQMWGELVDWAQTHMVNGDLALASAADIQIPQCVDHCEDAIALLRPSHAQWHGERGKG